MQHYDLSYLISPKLEESKAKELSGKILDELQKEGAVLDRSEEVLKISLAYPIQKQREAYFARIKFFLKKEGIGSVFQKLSAEPHFLRILLVKKDRPRKKLKRQRIYVADKKESPIKRERIELAEVEKKLDEIL